MSKFINADCIDVMREYPDNYFDIAIVDPPYFSGPEKRKFYGRKISPIGVQRLYGQTNEWEVPGKHYFDELYEQVKPYEPRVLAPRGKIRLVYPYYSHQRQPWEK